MENLTLASCSYNTPDVTITMLKSFFAHHGSTNVEICDNSTYDNDDTAMLLINNRVNYLRNVGGLHASSVDLLFGECKTDYMLLVDTDVIFLKSHEDIFNQFKSNDLTLLGEICGDRGGKHLYNRVHPWHCFINIKNIKDHNIRFYDNKRLSNVNDPKIYDVGASFFEDIKNAKLKIGNVKLQDDYYKHYEGMSWRTLKYGISDGNIDLDASATHNNVELLKYGKFIERMYNSEITKYKDIKINAK